MKTSKSKNLFQRAGRFLIGGVNSPVRAFKSVGGTPLFIQKAQGPFLWDADGNRYVDFVGSWGPMILGHGHPAVVGAVRKQIERGFSFGAPTDLEVEMAAIVCGAFPSVEKVRFVSSGTEAVMSAVRLARGYTGRNKIVKFSGGYHGHSDSLLVKAGSGAATLGVPDSAGVPASVSENTLVLRYNDEDSFRRLFEEQGFKIAAVIVEPVAANMGVVPPQKGFLEALRVVTEKFGTLLIFDEVITGFRLSFGGAQALFKIRPDLTCLGKIIGGGFPVGAFGGRKDVMEKLAPLGPVYQAGTLSGNPVAMASGIATLKALKKLNPYKTLAARTQALTESLAEAFEEGGIPARINLFGSMFTVFFAGSKVADYESAKLADAALYGRFFHALLGEGLYFPPAQFEAAFISAAHSPAVLKEAEKSLRRAIKKIK